MNEIEEANIDLENEIIILSNCQEKKLVKSCMKCIEYIDCETRKKYVLEVYKSMGMIQDSKDEGFNF
jgi:hypothetical protein